MPLTFPRDLLTAATLLLTCVAWSGIGSAAQSATHGLLGGGGTVLGQAVSLQVGGQTVPALHRERQNGEPRGAILLLPAPGDHADAAGLVRKLRLGLPEAGWDTLTIQLPEYFPSDSAARWLGRHGALEAHIRAGLEWLGQRGQPNPVVIGMGASGQAALAFAADSPPDALQAVTLISTPVEPRSAATQQLAVLRLPVLDLYAERDRPEVLATLTVRRRAAIDNEGYRQRIVPGTDDRFTGAQDAVVASVRAWLARHARGKQGRIGP